jgi:aldehyde:ferredoxin oxidoreductase
MAGFEGKMLEVNLSTGAIKKTEIDKDVLRKFIGGSGLAAKLMFDRVDPKIDALSPQNELFIVCGPISGTSLPGGARFSVCAKSPLTNMFAESSCGGDFASKLRSAGWDGIILQSASNKPVYLYIEDQKAEVRDASDLWGKNNHEVTQILKERHGGREARVVTIGQAGENLVRYAGVANGRSLAARCGMGAVMGSKKLKAIVVKGSGKVPLADPEKFAEKRKVLIQKAKDHVATQVLGMMGTNAAVDVSAVTGDLPGKNWASGDNTAIAAKTGGPVLSGQEFLTGSESCFGCTVGCKRVNKITEGPFAGWTGAGPEYEGVVSLGSNLLIDDMAAIIKMNDMCNDFGLDVISGGATIAMAMDCFEQGILTAKDLDGIELKWGDADAVMKMITKIAVRDGFGATLAEGTRRAAQKIGKGASEYAVEVKGLEVPMHDPRAHHGLGLAYATSARGACHTNDPAYSISTGIFDWPDFGLTPLLAAELKDSKIWGPVIKNSQDLGQIINSGVFCYMLGLVMNADDLMDLLSSSSGFDYTFLEIQECGERIWHMKRGVSNLMGITASDDTLPKRILTPTSEGPAAGSKIDLELMLRDYYPARGLNPDGRPSKETLDRLGLSDLAAKLY